MPSMERTDDANFAAVLAHLERARVRLAADQLAGPSGSCIENYEQWLDEGILDMALEELVRLGDDLEIASGDHWRDLRAAARLLPTSEMAQSLVAVIDQHDV